MPPRIVAALRREAAAALPGECCGAVLGVRRAPSAEIRTLVPVPNAATALDRYLIDAATVLQLERRACCAGLQLLGFYHSHPSGAGVPSALDLELAVPGFLYLIVQPADGRVRAWRLRDDRAGFNEVPLDRVVNAA